MNADKIKAGIVAGVLTLAVVVLPGSSGLIDAAGGQAEITVAVIAVWVVAHGIGGLPAHQSHGLSGWVVERQRGVQTVA